jgi:SAM-dependent methyltransferase
MVDEDSLNYRLPPPKGRTRESLVTHYLTERRLATQLKRSSSREERKQIMAGMYDELFRAVPDHPRLTRRADRELTRKANESRFFVLDRFLSPATVFAEFGSGDCLFANEVARRVRSVYAIDISDQRGDGFQSPANFTLVTYDGYDPPAVEPESVDVCFSDELIEHLHPADTEAHLRHVLRLLKPGGVYVFRTPHAQSGPDDVSRYFSSVAEGFHLKEWTYSELLPVMRDLGFDRFETLWQARRLLARLPAGYFLSAERAMAACPSRLRTVPAKLLIPSICCVATKGGA